ncbi:MAG: peptidyl-prolyl cis-trans isomerase [Nitrospirales bacterium]
MSLRTLLKEPLVHFLVLGAMLFVGYEYMNRGSGLETGQIVVTQGRIDSLRASFSRVWQRPPTPSEMDGLIRDYVREEVLAREAMALGLDRDDIVIRRRLRQKMEFIANDLTAPAEPSETQLQEYLVKHSDRFLVESRFTFRHVYLNPEQHGDTLQRDVATLLSELNRPVAQGDFRKLGDPILLNAELTDVPAGEVARQFGDEFPRQLERLPTGRWDGPVMSGYGVHVVFVQNRIPGKVPDLSTVREEVARAWADARRREDSEQFYQELTKRYAVIIEGASSDAEANALAAEAH